MIVLEIVGVGRWVWRKEHGFQKCKKKITNINHQSQYNIFLPGWSFWIQNSNRHGHNWKEGNEPALPTITLTSPNILSWSPHIYFGKRRLEPGRACWERLRGKYYLIYIIITVITLILILIFKYLINVKCLVPYSLKYRSTHIYFWKCIWAPRRACKRGLLGVGAAHVAGVLAICHRQHAGMVRVQRLQAGLGGKA